LRAQSEMAAIADFVQQDWVKQLTQDGNPQNTTRKHVDPSVAFPFQKEFSVGTIHGANAKTTILNMPKLVEIKEDVKGTHTLTTKTSSGVQSEVVVGSRVAPGSNPVSGPKTDSIPPGAASGGSDDSANSLLQSPLYIHKRGECLSVRWIVKWAGDFETLKEPSTGSKSLSKRGSQ
jgi:hypothetical protein